MFMTFKLIMVVIFLIMIMHSVNFIFSVKQNYTAKTSKFECGFPSVGHISGTYSIQFFFVLIIFVLFDMELLFLIVMFYKNKWNVLGLLIVYVLVSGSFYMEWKMNKLMWLV